MAKATAIAIFNQKGGVGKSTTASSLMAVLKERGERVLGIDIDSQGHLTKLCGINTKGENTVMELLAEEASFDETVKQSPFGDILPVDRNLQIYLKTFSEDINNIFKIKELVELVSDRYDYIIIDCPPNANQIALSSLVASQFVIVPTEAEYFSLDGVAEIAHTISSVKKRLNPDIKVLGILMVKYQPRRRLTKAVEEKINDFAKKHLDCGVFETKIEYGVAVPASQASKVSIFDYDKNSKPAKNYLNFVDELLAEVRKNG
jgi:chromosome partitioning protein